MTDAEENLLHPKQSLTLEGHETCENLFLDAFNADKIHHAWLFTGPKGVGKATFAWRVAKFLLAHGQKIDAGDSLFGDSLPSTDYTSLTVSQDHDSLARVLAGTHSDVQEIILSAHKDTGKMRREIGVDTIRALINFSSQTSSEGGWRIAIIDSVDDLNTAAANALLKLLEEPPKQTILMLVSHAPGKLLPTIRSRCRQLKFNSLPLQTIQNILLRHFPDLSESEQTSLSILSEGAPGKACSYAASDALTIYRDCIELFSSMPQLNVPLVHRLADKLSSVKNERAYDLFVELFHFITMRLMRMTATGESPAAVTNTEIDALKSVASKLPLEQQLDLWEKTSELFIRANTVHLDRKQLVINIFSDLAMALAKVGNRQAG